jgi:hypothetical protein
VQTNVYEKHLTASADHTFNRLTLEFKGSVTNYNYENLAGTRFDIFESTIPTRIPERDIRDYREDELTLRGTCEFTSKMAAFAEGAINREVYRQPINVAGIRRGSSGFDVLSGLRFGLTGKLTGKASIGWGEQESTDESLGPIKGVLLNADIIWMPTPFTMAEFLGRSEVATSTLVDTLGAVDRFYELSLQHAFWHFLVVRGFVSYEIADYADNPLVDQWLKGGTSVEYYFNARVSVMHATSTLTSSRPTRLATSRRTRCGLACGSGTRARRRQVSFLISAKTPSRSSGRASA